MGKKKEVHIHDKIKAERDLWLLPRLHMNVDGSFALRMKVWQLLRSNTLKSQGSYDGYMNTTALNDNFVRISLKSMSINKLGRKVK